MSALIVLMAAISTSALTYYLVVEDGPWEIIRKLRWKMGVSQVLDKLTGIATYVDEYAPRKDMEGLQMEYAPNGSVTSLIFSCTNCLSVYTSFLIAAWVLIGADISWGVMLHLFPLLWGFLAGTSLYLNIMLRGNYAHH
jgi:hypothetical protein